LIEQLNIRQSAEGKEETLSVNAAKSGRSQGRFRDEEPCPIRTAFQRDRDRIIHTKAFRRLKHKTQVFIDPQGDHYVTRLTHTLEVSQIARTIARALNLNEDLTEAISLGHDLGHTPFGHVGEDVLDERYPGGFRHNEQSLRIVDFLEKDGRGLNLTWEVRDGILKHSKSNARVLDGWDKVGTLEGEIVRISDIVAYINHDFEDAIREGVITGDELEPSVVKILGETNSRRIDSLVRDIIVQSWGVRTGETDTPAIIMSPEMREAADKMREFLFERVYNVSVASEETTRAKAMVNLLYDYFSRNEDKLPSEYRIQDGEPERRVVDQIAGMTDQYATRMAAELS